MLTEEQLEAARAKYGKIGVIEYGGHQLVFRRPTRENVRDYRRKMDSPSEKPDGLDQLAQVSMIAFDGEEDITRARVAFLGFLDEYPLFTGSAKALSVFNVLTGLVEEEEAGSLGKGASVRSSRPTSTGTGSPNGSAPAPEARSSATTVERLRT
jgi:hypothetical protein